MAGFCAHEITSFHPNFEGVPVGRHRPSRNLQLITSQPGNYFRSIPTCVKKTYLDVTDRRTDYLLWHNRALHSISQ